MDPNQNAQPVQQPVQPTPEPVKAQQAESPELQQRTVTPVSTPKQPSSHKTFFIVLIAGVLIILLLTGGFLLYSQQQNQSLNSPGMEEQSISSSPTIEPSPASPEEQEILKIDTGDVEKDLQDLNKDFQQL